MTIQEAIKSGQKFRLPAWDTWYTNKLPHVNKFSCADILRNDWEIEIEEEKIEITKMQLEKVLRGYNFSPAGFRVNPNLFRELGFKE